MSHLLAEVCINVQASQIRNSFTYWVPSQFSHIAAGWRVIVPFGSTSKEGFVLGTRQGELENELASKSILEVLDDEPWFDPEMLRTARWISEYYVCSLADAMRLFVPGKSGVKNQLIYSINEDSPIISLVQGNMIYDYILKKQTVSFPQLRAKFGSDCRQDLLRLQQQGLLVSRVVGTQRSKPRTIRKIQRIISKEKLAEILLHWKGKPAQKKILSKFLQEDFLTLSAGADGIALSAPLKALIEAGYLQEKREILLRDSYAHVQGFGDEPELTAAQRKVLEPISSSLLESQGKTFLLHGATGSGKTEIYMQAAAQALKLGKQVLVLIPEIAQTDQLLNRFRARFGATVAVIHSRLSVAERRDVWDAFRNGDIQIIIGARSAIFVPGGGIGLIIVDEEHEFTYKQEEHPRYHARCIALQRAEYLGATILLGSATPSLESFYAAKQGRAQLLTMPERIDGSDLPEVQIVDMREQLKLGRKGMISAPLEELLRNTFERGNQAILLLNRRGHSTFVMCRECGYVLKCSRCSVSLVYHLQGSALRCHYCELSQPSPETCPSCGSRYIRFFGAGTQKLEEELQALFPQTRRLRMDHDTTGGKMGHGEVLETFRQGRADVLLGTQMVAKGHDFANVTAVGILAADSALNLPDFRSAEKTFSLILQAAGRAGRGSLPGKVVVQTYHPEHYAVVAGAEQNYESFYHQEINFRQELNYPPCSQFIKLTFIGADEMKVRIEAETAVQIIQTEVTNKNCSVNLLGPYIAPISRIENVFRVQLLIQGHELATLKQILIDSGFAGNPAVCIDVDPLGMM